MLFTIEMMTRRFRFNRQLLRLKPYFYLLLCGVLVGESCNNTIKTYTTTIKGRVINAGTKAPIDSVRVVLKDGMATGGGWLDTGSGNTSSGQKMITYTDKNGYFEIQLKGTHEAFFALAKPNYQWGNSEYKSYGEGVHENEVFELKAYAWFEPILKSKGASYDSDTINFEYVEKEYRDSEIKQGNKFIVLNKNILLGKGPFETRNYLTAIGDKYQFYRIILRRQNTLKTWVDSVYIKSFETYRDTIYY